jgi:hypothetical protein
VPAAKPCMPLAVASSAPRLPRPLFRMNAPAEMRGAISDRVMGSPMGHLAGGSARMAPDPVPIALPVNPTTCRLVVVSTAGDPTGIRLTVGSPARAVSGPGGSGR